MKIAVVAQHAGSLSNFRGPLLAELVSRGHRVLAFAPDFTAETRAAMHKLGVQPMDWPLSRTGMNPLRDLGSVISLLRLFRLHRPSVAFSYAIKPVIYGTLAAWLAGVPRRYAMIEGLGYAFTADQGAGARRRIARLLATRLYRVALRFVERVIFLNPDDRAEFVDGGLVRPDRAVVLGGIGLDLDQWSYAAPPEKPVTFLMVGRILRDKGVEDYVSAARIVAQDCPGARFILLGPPDDNPTGIPASTVKAWVSQGLIEWPGHGDVRPWFGRASVFVLPSYYREGVPRTAQEAMALGLPVITTNVPGCRETVVDGLNGFLVPPRDPETLARAMRHFIEHPEDIVPMGMEGRRLAEERFDVHVQNQKLLAFMNLDDLPSNAAAVREIKTCAT